MADTTDELIVVVEDELITAETTNKNNKYLETLMTDYAGELRQYLDNQLQTLENEFQGDLTNLETTLQGSIDELEARVDSISFAPDYSTKTTVASPYTATKDCFIANNGSQGYNGSTSMTINNIEVWHTGGGLDASQATTWVSPPFFVKSGDVVRGNTLYKYEILGE